MRTKRQLQSGRPVLVTFYVVRPRGRSSIASSRSVHHHHHHHHHHYYHHLHRAAPRPQGGGSNRKAELLAYTQHLRSLARREPAPPRSSPALPNRPKPVPSVIVPVQPKLRKARSPSCFGDWKRVLLFGFLAQPFGSLRRRKGREGRREKGAKGGKMGILGKYKAGKRDSFISRFISMFVGEGK